MAAQLCNKCGKQLPAGSFNDLCGLCAIGLTPAAPLPEFTDLSKAAPVEGRILSGSTCPHCHAEMTLTDLSRRSCSICGAYVPPEALHMPAGPIIAQRLDSSIPREQRWPDDAPLW